MTAKPSKTKEKARIDVIELEKNTLKILSQFNQSYEDMQQVLDWLVYQKNKIRDGNTNLRQVLGDIERHVRLGTVPKVPERIDYSD